MNERYPQSNSAESDEGTAAHWVMAEMLNGRVVAEGSLSPNGIVITDEMIDGANLVTDAVISRITNGPLHVEETVSITAIHPECYGTPDIWAAENNLEIIDYKFGHRFVDEYFNQQGLLYMLGILGKLEFVPDTVSFTIVQPRCFYRGEPVRTHTYKLSEAKDHLKRLREAAERAMLPAPTATTGSQCEHCPGRHACPTLQRAAYSDAETSTDQQPVELSPQAAATELKMLERALLRLTARVEGLREQTLINIKLGKQVPHYKAESGRKRLVWTVPPEQLIKKLGKKAVVPKVITPGQARKLLLDEAIISSYSHYIDGAVKLVEDNASDAARVFKLKE